MRRGLKPSDRVVTYPHMGNYHIAFDSLARHLGCEVQPPPTITRKTVELGTRHSPEFVCLPFKYNLGNFIEALELGANTIVQAGGGCRFNYYAEIQELILRDFGYEFELLKLTGARQGVMAFLDSFRLLNPAATRMDVIKAFALAWRKGEALDTIEDMIRKNIGFEVQKGSFELAEKRFHKALDEASTIRAVNRVLDSTVRELREIEVERPDELLRVGVVGELYLLMEPFSNYFIEKELASRGVEVHRFLNLTGLLLHSFTGRRHHKKMVEYAGPYLEYHIGAEGTESVAMTRKLMSEGFDGVVHVKPFGCMPEVNAMSALQRIGREHTFPILYFSFDSQASETGVKTRLEAFCDMLQMRKKGVSA